MPRSQVLTVTRYRSCLLPSRTRRDVLTLAVFAVAIIAAIAVGVSRDWLSVKSLWELITRIRDAHGTVMIFTLLFIAVAAIGLPITPLVLVGGVLFGIWKGVLLSWGASMIGAVIGYYVARKLGKNSLRRIVERLAGRHVQFAGRRARRTLLRLRLIPVSPFGGLNFAAGLAGMPFKDFFVATALGILPGLAIFTYFASQVLTGGKAARHTAIVHTLIAAGVLWALTYAPAVWDRFFGEEDDEEIADTPATTAS